MERTVWNDPLITQDLMLYKRVGENKYYSKLDVDSEVGRAWGIRYKIKSIPAILIIDAKTGEVIRRATGGMSVGQLHNFLIRRTDTAIEVYGETCPAGINHEKSH